jgi:hypothetical protein
MKFFKGERPIGKFVLSLTTKMSSISFFVFWDMDLQILEHEFGILTLECQYLSLFGTWLFGGEFDIGFWKITW